MIILNKNMKASKEKEIGNYMYLLTRKQYFKSISPYIRNNQINIRENKALMVHMVRIRLPTFKKLNAGHHRCLLKQRSPLNFDPYNDFIHKSKYIKITLRTT